MDNALCPRERENSLAVPSHFSGNSSLASGILSKSCRLDPRADAWERSAITQRDLLADQRLARREKPSGHALNLNTASQSIDLAEVMAVLPAAVVVLNCKGCISLCNAEAEALLNMELSGLRWRDIISKRFRTRADDGHEVSLDDGRRVSLTTRSLGSELGQVILIKDLTNTRRLQEQLDRHRRLSDMGRMMSALAHQIRTPLAAAILHAGNLQLKRNADSSTLDYSGRILSRLHNIERQVKGMLRFAKGGTAPRHFCSLTELLSGLMHAANELLATRDDSKALKYLWVNQVGDAELCCDIDGITGALINLLENAIDASPTGSAIEICCKRTERVTKEHGESRAGIEFAIIDQGPGVDSRTALASEEGFRTTKHNGTGLGLLIVRTLAEAHEGHFELGRDVDSATRAALWLPLVAGNSSAK